MATQILETKTPPQIVDDKEKKKRKLLDTLIVAMLLAWYLLNKSKTTKQYFQKQIYDKVLLETKDKHFALQVAITITNKLLNAIDMDDSIKAMDYIYNKERKIIRDICNDIEAKEKQEYIKEILNSNNNIYISSMHDDCAKGHIKYQGEYYYKNKQVDNLKSLEWVIGSPAWLITRPNCRHYVVPVSDEFYKNNPNPKSAVDILNIHTEIGERGIGQTLQGGIYPSQATEEYKNRYRILSEMYKITPNAKIYGKMTKMQILINNIKK